MSVRSPDVGVTVQALPVYDLTIGVTPNIGYIGEDFTFSGVLTADGIGMPATTVTLYVEIGGVPSLIGPAQTDALGNWQFVWTADTVGDLIFYATAL